MFRTRQQAPLQQGLFPMGMLGGAEQHLNAMIPQMLGMSPAEAMFARFGESRNMIRQMQDFQLQVGRRGESPSGGAMALDTQRAQQFMVNAQQMLAGGRSLSAEQMMQAQGTGATLAQNLPMIRQIATAMGVPQEHLRSLNGVLFGSAGSAVEFSGYSNRVLAGAIDPPTAQRGLDGATRARMGENIFRELTGPGGLREQVRGFDSMQLGEVMEGLSARGQLGISRRSLSLETQARTLGNMSEADLRAAALQTKAGAATIGENGRVIDPQGFNKVMQDVKTTYSTLQNASGTITQSSLAGMTGGQELLDMSEAKRVAQRIGEVTQSLKAMDELFQENGQTASLPQLMRAVESLTDNASSFMSEAQTSSFLRTAQQVSRVGNMSLDTYNSLRSLGAQTAQRYGASGIVGSLAATDAIAQINGSTDAFNVRSFGSMNKEATQQALITARAAGAASTAATNFQLVTALKDEIQAPAGSEAAAFIAAMQAGEATYTFNGETKSTLVSDQQTASFLQSSGVDRSRIETLRRDKRRLEGVGVANADTFASYVAAAQGVNAVSDAAKLATVVQSDSLRTALGSTLRGLSEGEQSELLKRMSLAATDAAINMSSADANNPIVRDQRLVEAAMGVQGVTPAMQAAMRAKATLGDSLYSGLNGATGNRTAEDYRRMFGREALANAELEKRRNAVDAFAAESASGIGASSIYARIGDFMLNENNQGRSIGFKEAAAAVLGGDNAAAIAVADPQGELAAVFGYQSQMKALDPINNAGDFEKWKAYAAVTAGLNKGGSFAKDALAAAEKAGITLEPSTRAKLVEVGEDQTKAGNALLEAAGISKTSIGIRARYAGVTKESVLKNREIFEKIQDGAAFTDETATSAASIIEQGQTTLAELENDPKALENLTADQRNVVTNLARGRRIFADMAKKYGMSVPELLRSGRGKLSSEDQKTLGTWSTALNADSIEFSAAADSWKYSSTVSPEELKKTLQESRDYANKTLPTPAGTKTEKPVGSADSQELAGSKIALSGSLTLYADSTVEAALLGEKLGKTSSTA
jgi:hypothetical protein